MSEETTVAAAPTEAKIASFSDAAEAARKSIDSTPEPQPAPEASEPKKAAEPSEAVPESAAVETAEDSPLLSQETIDELTPDQLKAYRKRLQGDYTRKTQATAAERKAVAEERKRIEAESSKIENLIKVNEAYERDPIGTLRALAEQHGLKFSEQPTDRQIARAEKTLAEINRDSLGTELDVLADRQQPVWEEMERRFDEKLEQKLEPLRQQQKVEIAMKEAEAAMTTFQSKHPDYKRYEAKMGELATKILPSGGITQMEYIEYLYQLSSGQEKAIIEALDANNRAVSKSEPLPPGGGVNPERVSPHMPKGISFKEGFERAAELARQGTLVVPK